MDQLKLAISFVIAFLVGAGTRWFDLPAPAPPTFVGAFLIVAITAGYLVTDRLKQSIDRTGEPVAEQTAGQTGSNDSS